MTSRHLRKIIVEERIQTGANHQFTVIPSEIIVLLREKTY
jgi:hypothetical protein